MKFKFRIKKTTRKEKIEFLIGVAIVIGIYLLVRRG